MLDPYDKTFCGSCGSRFLPGQKSHKPHKFKNGDTIYPAGTYHCIICLTERPLFVVEKA